MYKVMIVEDEMLVRIGLKSSINWKDMDIEVTADLPNGKLALEAYSTNKPDIILTDIKMPVMDGLEFIRRIRENDKRTRVIVLTCYDEFDLIHSALQLGVTDYILKLKMSPQEIAAVVQKAVDELKQMQNQSVPEAPVLDTIAVRNTILSEQLRYETYDTEHFAQMIQKLDLPCADKGIVLAMMSVRENSQTKNAVQQNSSLIRNVILNLANDILGDGVTVSICPDTIALLLPFADSSAPALEEQLLRLGRSIHTYTGYLCHFYVSGCETDYLHLPQMYAYCSHLQEFGYFLDEACAVITSAPTQKQITELCREKLSVLPSNISTDIKGYHEIVTQNIDLLLHNADIQSNDINRMFSYLIMWPIVNSPISYVRLKDTASQHAHAAENSPSLEANILNFQRFVSIISEKNAKSRKVSREVAEVVDIIDTSYSQSISLQAVAARVGISPNYLSTLFKKEIGMKFVDYINQVRIDHAKELFLTTHMKSYEVAERVGFYDESYFSRIFKSVTGLRPKEWKRQILEYETEPANEK